MRVVDRLISYLQFRRIVPYSFERNCKLANGFLKKQEKGKGRIGSDVIEIIHANYPDLNIMWLVTGEGEMLTAVDPNDPERQSVREDKQPYTKTEIIGFLNERIALLEAALADKEKIIKMLEERIVKNGGS